MRGVLVLASLLFIHACSGFRVSQGPQLRLDEVHPFGARHIAFSPGGDRLASGGVLGDIRIWAIPGNFAFLHLMGVIR